MPKKNKNRGKTIMGLFIVIIMVMSVMGFIFGQNSTTKVRQKGITFTAINGGWITEIDKKRTVFSYLPEEVESLELDEGIVTLLKQTRMIYSTSDLDDKFAQSIAQAQYQLSNVLSNNMQIYAVQGLTKENEYNAPVITCDNATAFVPVLYFKRSNETKFELKNNCIFIKGMGGNDFFLQKDRLLYSMMGLI